MDRMTDSGSVGWEFESLRDHKNSMECEFWARVRNSHSIFYYSRPKLQPKLIKMFDFEKLEVYKKAKQFNSTVSLFLEDVKRDDYQGPRFKYIDEKSD